MLNPNRIGFQNPVPNPLITVYNLLKPVPLGVGQDENPKDPVSLSFLLQFGSLTLPHLTHKVL